MLRKNLCESDTLVVIISMTEYLEEIYYVFEEIKPHVLTRLINLERSFKNNFPELILQQHE
jgi:hypothetical protein